MKKYIYIIFAIGIFVSCNQNETRINSESSKINLLNDTSINNIIVDNYDLFESNSQFFTMNIEKKIVIKGLQGTRIIFPKGCFNTKEKEVRIELKECYSIPEMIKNNLSTITSKNELLETDGMIYINITNAKGDTLSLVKSVHVETVTHKKDNDMQIFHGKKDKSIVWELSKSKLKTTENSIVISDCKSCDSVIKGKPIIIGTENYQDYIYSFILNRTGWINLDKFYNNELTEINIKIKKDQLAIYYLIFQDYNMLLAGFENNGNIEFLGGNRVPKSEKAFVIGLIKNLDNSYNFALLEINTNQRSYLFPQLRKITQQELDEVLLKTFGADIWSRPKIIM